MTPYEGLALMAIGGIIGGFIGWVGGQLSGYDLALKHLRGTQKGRGL